MNYLLEINQNHKPTKAWEVLDIWFHHFFCAFQNLSSSQSALVKMDTFTSWRVFVAVPKNPSGCAHRILLPLRIDFPTAPPKTTAQQKKIAQKVVVCHILVAPQKVSTKKFPQTFIRTLAACQQETHQGTLSDAFDQ